jgi:hypothetical protein
MRDTPEYRDKAAEFETLAAKTSHPQLRSLYRHSWGGTHEREVAGDYRRGLTSGKGWRGERVDGLLFSVAR